MPKNVGYIKAKMTKKSNEEISNEGTGPVTAKKPRMMMKPSQKPAKQ